jgi:hypothetical protein
MDFISVFNLERLKTISDQLGTTRRLSSAKEDLIGFDALLAYAWTRANST